jgi:hypothetical protein
MSIMQHRSHQVVISKLTEGVQKMLDDLVKKMYELSGGQPVEFTIPENHVDDLSSFGRGRSWMDTCQTTPPDHALVEAMSKKDLWNMAGPVDGKYVWNEVACMDFMRKAGEIVDLIITLVHLGAGPPVRGEELVVDQIENGIQPRTLYLVFGQMLAIRRRSKDTNKRGIDSFNACYFPKKLSDAICYYLKVIRPLEKLVAEQLYPEPEEQLDYSMFLYVKEGKRMTSNQFSSVLSNLTREYIGVGLTLQPARHVMIAFHRAFVEPTIVEKGNNVGDLLSSHNSKTAYVHYAREFGFELEGLTSMLLLDIQEWCDLYHDAIGLGNRTGPLISIRTKRRVAQLLVTAATLQPDQPLPTRAVEEILSTLGKVAYTAGLEQLKSHAGQEIHTAVAHAFQRFLVDFATLQKTQNPAVAAQPADQPARRLPRQPDVGHLPRQPDVGHPRRGAQVDRTAVEGPPDPTRRSKRQLSNEDVQLEAKRRQIGQDLDGRFGGTHKDPTGRDCRPGTEGPKNRFHALSETHRPGVGEEARSGPDETFYIPDTVSLGDIEDLYESQTAVPCPTKPLPSRLARADVQDQLPPTQQLSAMSLQPADLPAQSRREVQVSPAQLLKGLREHLRDPSAQFKSEAQENLVRFVLSGRHTIGVLPTGSGKSLAFELACRIAQRSVVVAVPFRLLALQVQETATRRGLRAEQWVVGDPRDGSEVKLIIVAYETLTTDDFVG